MPDEDRSVLDREAHAPDDEWSYGGLPDQVADVFLPPAPAAGNGPSRSVVFLVHGGFWRPEYDRRHIRPLAAALAGDGHIVVSVEYRRLPGRPDATRDDLRLALSHLPTLLRRHGAEGAHVTLVGHSAGGQLVLLLAADPGRHGSCLALAPVADLQAAAALALDGDAVGDFLGVPAEQRPDLDPARRPAPAGAVTVLHGADDALVPVSVAAAYAAAIGDTVQLLVLPDCGHFALIDPASSVWPLVQTELARLVLNEARD